MNSEDLEHYLERLQHVFMLSMRRISKEIMENECKVTGPQIYILRLLQKKGKCTVSGLAEEMCVKPSAITAMIDRLFKQGFVFRERDEQDRRVVFIEISETGREVLEKAIEKRKQILMKYFAHLNPEELKFLVSIYEKLSQIQIKE